MSIPKRETLFKAGLKRIWCYRSAITGRFVSAEYAKLHPDTTIMQKLRDVVVK